MKQLFAALIIVLCLAFLVQANAQIGSPTKSASDPRVEKVLKEIGLKYKIDSDGDFKLTIEVEEDGRTQLVFILSNTSELGSLEIRKIWSIAYVSDEPFPHEIANFLLEKNGKVKLGAWQSRKMGDKYVAIFEAQIAADADKHALLLALQAVIQTADEVEEKLTRKDDY